VIPLSRVWRIGSENRIKCIKCIVVNDFKWLDHYTWLFLSVLGSVKRKVQGSA